MSVQRLIYENIVAIALAEERSLETPCVELNCTWAQLESRILADEPIAISTCLQWLGKNREYIINYRNK